MKRLIFFLLLIPALSHAVQESKVAGAGGDADTLGGQSDSFYTDIRNQAGFINVTGIPNWDSATAIPMAPTGVDEEDSGVDSCKVTVDGDDDSLIDIFECHVHILGPHYEFFNITSIDPGLEVGENSKFIGMTLGGYTTSNSGWTDTQKLTVVPLARVNTAFGISGPGSTISLIRDDRYFVTKRAFYDRIWHEEAIGALYVSGGKIFANTTSGLVLSQEAGVLYDGQTKRQVLSAFGNMSAVFLHLAADEINWVGSKKLLVIDNVNYNPAGSGLVSLSTTNKYKIDTILKSPKGPDGVPEGGWFLISGAIEYDTQADALAAVTDGSGIRWGLFVNQATSGLVPLALIVQQRDLTTTDAISDQRPCLVCRP